MEEDRNLLIIKLNANISQRSLTRIRESIECQRKSGLIILPEFCEVIVTPKDTLIEVEGTGNGRDV